MAETPYSRIREVHITNFMSIRYAKVEFNNSDIVKVLGYNDIGKSAILRAIGVALLNKWPSKQKSFIKDETRYFQVDVVFDDDVVIRYEKHDSGSSLYEMYQNDELMFTTKLRDGLYEKITGVPEKIYEYLGLMSTPDGIDLNYGVNSDKQLLVETTGSENYKTINTVLKSEEIYRAVNSLNKDNNTLQGQINQTETEAYSYISQADQLIGLDEALLSTATKFNSEVENLEGSVQSVNEVCGYLDEYVSLPVLPSVEGSKVELGAVPDLNDIVTLLHEVTSIEPIPEVAPIEGLEGIGELTSVMGCLNDLQVAEDQIVPHVDLLNAEAAFALESLMKGVVEDYQDAEKEAKTVSKKLLKAKKQNDELISELREQGEAVTECPNCGELHIAEVA